VRRLTQWMVAISTLTVSVGIATATAAAAEQEYEVWLTDQNNTAGFSAETPRGTHGGRLLIYNSRQLDRRGGPVNAPDTIDLAQLFAVGGPSNSTGNPVVRPHMLAPSHDHRFVALSFVASGHVAIFDARTRAPLALFHMSIGAGGGRQAHASFWTPDGRSLVVANQNGKRLERIDYDPTTSAFTLREAAMLDLATCTTPNGLPCQTATPVSDRDPGWAGPNNGPDNAPIMPVLSSDGKAYVTLRGGGLFVIDVKSTPMAIVGEYGTAAIGRDGLGGRQLGRRMVINSGTGTPETNPTEFRLYQLQNRFPAPPAFASPNVPGVTVFSYDKTPSTPSDAHGMALTRRGRYLWQFDRLENQAVVFDARTSPPRRIGKVALTGASPDPTPDIVDASPRGNRLYVALRGPLPQTGAHASVGATPGLGVVTLRRGGRTGVLDQVLRTSNVSPLAAEESDPHGIAVVLDTPAGARRFAADGGGTLPFRCDVTSIN
jgi:hypothetical protein